MARARKKTDKPSQIESRDTRRIAIEAYRGTVSLAFEPAVHKRVAVKIVIIHLQ